MHKKTLFVLSFLVIFTTINAQQPFNDSIAKARPHYRYVGIQANLLFQQFVNFNGNSGVNVNPYTFVYSKSSKKSGAGFAFGTGLLLRSQTKNDGVSSVSTNDFNVSFRVGYERKYFQESKWIPFWGIGADLGFINNFVEAKQSQPFPSPSFTSTIQRGFAGASVRGGVLYAISKHVLLGTEGYFSLQASLLSRNKNSFGSVSQTQPEFNFGFNVPTALFLTFRF